MSYSFSVVAATAAALAAAASAKLDEVCAQQPIHERDRGVADQTIASVLALTAEPAEGQHLHATVTGSCWGPEDGPLTGASLSVSIYPIPATG